MQVIALQSLMIVPVFGWVFFLPTKDETNGILQNFIRQIENQLNHRVKIIRSDNGTEFKNRDMLEFVGNKGMKTRVYCNAQNSTAFEEKCDEVLVEKPNVKGVGTSEVTNSAGTLQTPNANASEEADEDEELIVVSTAIKHYATKKEAYSTGISEDTPEILAFRRELDDLAQKNLREVPKNKATSTNLVNSGSGIDDAQPADQNDLDMPELTIFNKPQKGIFDEASYDEEGMVHDFNNLPTEVAVSP
ncbi:putative ribonuclease H-like domain-containing protein, partial [Tanacetum coccineum]